MSFDYKRLIDRKVNVGDKDKKMRLISGSILMFVSLFTAKIILLVAGMVLIATGYTQICPAYSAMDKNTL
jgi:cytochrome b subunit of formate dehydrogenase